MNASIKFLLPALFIALLPPPRAAVHAAQPLLEKTDLFTDGKSIYRTGRLTVARFNESWVRAGDGGDEPAGPRPDATPPASGLSEPERREGFHSLFNGQTLDGWQGDTAGYQARDGLLVCTKQGGRLQTERKYGNFVFRNLRIRELP